MMSQKDEATETQQMVEDVQSSLLSVPNWNSLSHPMHLLVGQKFLGDL